ncbi:MAG: hypothetical protein MET45_14925 [Nostoc sp. LLA-1]|nr:hypothetical protein [Cyanocohniella sp. LLY]
MSSKFVKIMLMLNPSPHQALARVNYLLTIDCVQIVELYVILDIEN